MSEVIVLFLGLFLNLCSSQTYVLNDKEGLGRVFDGIGGLSGGGVSSVGFELLPGTMMSTGGLVVSCLNTSF